MRKRTITGLITAGLLIFGAAASGGSGQTSELNSTKPNSGVVSGAKKVKEPVKPTCDGERVTTACVLDGVTYATYVYHPAVPEKSHTETTTTYREEVTSYCTLCNDGTYSPSCATGRGACSHHGGVAQWNAPRTSQVPVNTSKTVIDKPAQEAYYEKVPQ